MRSIRNSIMLVFLTLSFLIGVSKSLGSDNDFHGSTAILQQMRDDMAILKETVKQQNVLIGSLMSTATRQDVQLKSQVAQLKSQDAQLQLHDAQMKSQDSQLKAQNEQLKAQNERIANLQRAVNRHESAIAQLRHKIGDQSHAAEQSSADQPNPILMNSEVHSNVSSRRSQGIIRRSLPVSMVAFQAIKDAEQASIGANQNVLFERVTLNLGNGYHPQHGLFIVPRSGIYVISVTTLHPVQSIYFHGVIVHQGQWVAALHGHDGTWEQASQTVLIQANAGDEIWVQNIGPTNIYMAGGAFSTFSGFLLCDI